MTDDLVISPSIRSKLDDSVLSQLRAVLHPVDCQTCGERCGAEDELALAVDDSGVGVIMASLHHLDCRKSEWRNLSADLPQVNFHTTWRARTLMWNAADHPLFLVNPSCELATLQSAGIWRRRWQLTTLNGFIKRGFSRQAEPLALSRLPRTLRADLGPTQVRVQVQNGSQTSTWTTEISREVYEKILERKRIIVGVTSMADPKEDDLTEASLGEMIRRGDIICACAAADNTSANKTPGTEVKNRAAAVEAMAKRSMRGPHGAGGGASNAREADGDPIGEPFVAVEMLGDVEENLSPEYSRMLANPLRRLNKNDRILALGMYILQHAAGCWTHVMLPDPGTASNYEYNLQRLCKGFFPVTRAATDCTPARGKITVGTYKEFEAAGRRLERHLSAASGFKVLGIAIDPAAGFTPGGAPLGFTRYCTRLIEV